MDPDSSLSRRALLQRGLFVLSAVGVTSAGLLPEATAAAAEPPGTTLLLSGADCEYWPAQGEPGDPPAHGDRATLTGRLVSDDGTQIGRFCGESFFVEGAFVGAAEDSSLEVHTFSLADGSISGQGVRGTSTSEFAVVGGTGRYRSAKGTYAATLSLPEFGGNGSASFEFHFMAALPAR